MNLYPLKLKAEVVEKIWGGNQFKNFFNKKLDDKKYGESWEVSVRKDCNSYIENGEYKGITLSQLLEKKRCEILGEEVVNKYGNNFPLLVKYLDINDKLSVQVHPNDEYALKIENENNGKSECWYVIDASKDASLILGLKNGIDKNILKNDLEKQDYKDLFNIVNVKKGDFIYIRPGIVHGTLDGQILICEIQQNSDLTYRIYDFNRKINGVYRQLHIDKALDVINNCDNINFTHDKDRKKIVLSNEIQKEDLLAGEYFNVEKFKINGSIKENKYKNFKIILILDGNGKLKFNEKEYDFVKGDTFFIPANLEFLLIGNCEFIKTYL